MSVEYILISTQETTVLVADIIYKEKISCVQHLF
jgi:hypothetical protein